MTTPIRMKDATPSSQMSFIALDSDLSAGETGLSAAPDTRDAWLALAPSQAWLHPDFETCVLTAAAVRLDVEIFYADDAAPHSQNTPLRLKPTWNPALLQAQDYVGAPVIVRGSTFHRLGGLDQTAGTAALYDLLLRAQAQGVVIDALRGTLLAHRGERPHPTDADRCAALRRALAGSADVLPGLAPRSSRVRRVLAEAPPITLVVPTRQSRRSDGRAHVEVLLESLLASTWPHDRLVVLIGDDRPDVALYGDLSRWPFDVQLVSTARDVADPFNYAAKMNRLWRIAPTEHVVLLNDDVEVVAADWLEALATFSLQDDVGGVGARLLYPDGSLQHAGVVGGLMGVFAHAWIGQAADAPAYGDWPLVQRDWSAVTGAVFATRRSALEAVNGFDERFSLEYNDIDLCLRMRAAGLRMVQAPDAVLMHHEKASRGHRAPAGSQTAAFLARWSHVILDDPAYHPDLSRDGFVVHAEPQWEAWYSGLPPPEGSNPGDFDATTARGADRRRAPAPSAPNDPRRWKT